MTKDELLAHIDALMTEYRDDAEASLSRADAADEAGDNVGTVGWRINHAYQRGTVYGLTVASLAIGDMP